MFTPTYKLYDEGLITHLPYRTKSDKLRDMGVPPGWELDHDFWLVKPLRLSARPLKPIDDAMGFIEHGMVYVRDAETAQAFDQPTE